MRLTIEQKEEEAVEIHFTDESGNQRFFLYVGKTHITILSNKDTKLSVSEDYRKNLKTIFLAKEEEKENGSL